MKIVYIRLKLSNLNYESKMENNENLEGNNLNVPSESNQASNSDIYGWDVKISLLSLENLREIAKWTKILSTLGLIGIGIYILGAIFLLIGFSVAGASAGIPGMQAATIIPTFIFLIIFLCIYILPILWMYRFSKHLKQAIISKDSVQLSTAIDFLKKHYKFIGIFTVIVLAIYALFIIGAFIVGIVAGFSSYS